MSTVNGIDFLRQFLSPFLKGQNVDALFGTFGDEDQRLNDLSVAVTDQLTISTSSGVYTDKLLAGQGIVRPAELGMEDLAFKRMGIEIGANKQITEVVHTILATFYGDDTVKAFAQSSAGEPFVLQDGMDLRFTLEDGIEQVITFKATDFLNITQASAAEVADVITRYLRDAGYKGYGLAFNDPDVGETFVRIFGSAQGPYSLVRVLGGEAQTVLKFPTLRGTELALNDTVWEITRTIGDTFRFRWTGSGSQPALDKVFVGDQVLIYGGQFKTAGFAGTYTVTGVRPAAAIPTYDSGYFEFEKNDFTGLNSSLPDQAPPANQVAAPWSAFTSYNAGTIVTYNGNNYESLQGSNLGNAPDLSPLYWEQTSKDGVFYTITLTQALYEDLMFFLGFKNTPYEKPRYALAWEPAEQLLRVYLPASTRVVKRDLIGSAHLHALYSKEDLNGSFGSATVQNAKVQVLSEYSVQYPASGYDNIGFGGELTWGSNTIEIDYVQRENGRTTLVTKEPHGITGVADAAGNVMSPTIINVQVDRVNADDPDNAFPGPYAVDPAATYTLSPNVAFSREKILQGESRNTLLVKGFIPDKPSIVLFDLNKDTQEGPVRILGAQIANAPTTVNILSISQNGTTVTVTTQSPHGALPGLEVQIGGTLNFNGVYTVDSISGPTVYTFTKTPPAIVAESNVGTSATLVDGVASTLIIDPSYEFKKGHAPGADVTVLESDRAYIPEPNGVDYPPYITGTADGRVFVEQLIQEITAAGINLEIIIIYPDDTGLGNQGEPKDEDESPHSEVVEVWGP